METIDRIVAAGLGAIESQVALIDEDGVIVYTNDTWDEFGRENGLEGEPIGPGDEYLVVSRSDDEADAHADADSNTACEGLESVRRRPRPVDFEYPAIAPTRNAGSSCAAPRSKSRVETPWDVDGARFEFHAE